MKFTKKIHSLPFAKSEPPRFVTGVDDKPSRYEVPNEKGYFPAGSDDIGAIVEVENATLYQLHPRCGEKPDKPLAAGTLTLRDPDGGTADDVAFVGECDGIAFYVMKDDTTTKISEKEFMLMLPRDYILLDLTECGNDETVSHIAKILAARTQFVVEIAEEGLNESNTPKYPENLPGDPVSKAMFRTSSMVARLVVSVSKEGAGQMEKYGDKKRESITESKKVNVSQTSINAAKATRNISEKTHAITVKISDKISDAIGGKVGRAAAIKEGDTASRKKARRLLLASTISYAEVADGASEGYEIMVKSAQSQATSFVAKKYGDEAAELVRHTAGATANFGRAALTARRVVDVKKLAKSVGKQMVKETVKSSVGIK